MKEQEIVKDFSKNPIVCYDFLESEVLLCCFAKRFLCCVSDRFLTAFGMTISEAQNEHLRSSLRDDIIKILR